MASPTLPAYDKLSEALLGLTLLALDRPREEHPRLIEQFREKYPEIVVLEDRQAETIRYTEKALRQLERPFHAEDLRKAVPAAFARRPRA